MVIETSQFKMHNDADYNEMRRQAKPEHADTSKRFHPSEHGALPETAAQRKKRYKEANQHRVMGAQFGKKEKREYIEGDTMTGQTNSNILNLQNAASSSGDSKEISLSIEETNALRKKLGMKPLDVGDDVNAKPAGTSDNPLDHWEEEKRKKQEKIDQKALAKQERMRMEREKVVAGKSIGEILNDEGEDDAAEWAAASKKRMERNFRVIRHSGRS